MVKRQNEFHSIKELMDDVINENKFLAQTDITLRLFKERKI